MNRIPTEYDEVNLLALETHPENPRRGDIGAIYESIETNGFYGAVVAQRSTGRILAGNHRFEAARLAGAETIPVLWVDVDDETALRILLVDNASSDKADNDLDTLAEILRDFAEGPGLEGTGYDGDDLDDLLALLDGPPDLEDVAGRSYVRGGTPKLFLTVSPDTAEAWNRYRARHSTDDEALEALLADV